MDNETTEPLKEDVLDDVPVHPQKIPKDTDKEKTYMEHVNEIETEEEDESVYDAMVDAEW